MICLSITEHLERRKRCPKDTSDGPNTARNVSENNGMVNLGFSFNLIHVNEVMHIYLKKKITIKLNTYFLVTYFLY